MADQRSTIAYKLAQFQVNQEHPEESLRQEKVIPETALVSEFQWILDSLRNRCLNPETAIADTIIETWEILKKNGRQMSVLQVARELNQTAQNAFRSEKQKINFRMSSRYWLKHNSRINFR